jgi:formylglycine-generating enzyme required for sulfatase activity
MLFACVACAATPPTPSPGPLLPAPAPAATAAVTAATPVPSASAAGASEPATLASATPASSSEPGLATATCPDGEVAVPPTPGDGFTMAKGLKGAHKVVLTHGFCMDQTEVTVREYARCVEAGVCKEPWRGDPYSTYPTKLDEPVDLVSWPKAHAFCEWAGKRLPTEAEWEWAATGPEQYRYPWGNEPEPSCEMCDYTKFGAPKWEAGGDIGCGGGGPSPVGTHPKGDRIWPGGKIHDLAGNVWEWVEDAFAPLASDPVVDPVVRLDVSVHAIRGGGWNRSYAAMVVTYRGAAHYTYQVPALGFRCVRGEPLATPSPHYE